MGVWEKTVPQSWWDKHGGVWRGPVSNKVDAKNGQTPAVVLQISHFQCYVHTSMCTHVCTRICTECVGHSFYSNYNHILLNSTLRKTPHRLIKEDNQTLAHWSTLHLSKLLFSARIAISKQWCLLIILLFLHELNCMYLSTTKRKEHHRVQIRKKLLYAFFMIHVSFYLHPILPHHLILTSLGFLFKCCKVPTLTHVYRYTCIHYRRESHMRKNMSYFFLSLGLLA